MNQPARRVVIVGGGFAGLFAARTLSRAPVQVTLLDRAEHHLFQPMLYQCATGILSEGKIAAPLRDLLKRHRNVEFVIAEVTGIDAAERRVLARRPLGREIEFGYDYLILAAGVRQSYFGHDEYAPIAPGMKTIEDAMKIRRRIFGAFEMAESADDPAERARWLTFALVGAGPTGVELAGQIREVATKTLRSEYRNIEPEDARVLLFDGGEAPLAMFGPKLSALAARDLGKLGVELHMGSIVTHVDTGGLEVKDHDGKLTRYDTWNVLWTAGVEAPPLATAVAKATGAEQDRAGRLLCGKDLSLPGHPDILVTGDMMSLDKLPGVAEVAMQSGLYAGRKISQEAQGHTYDKPFRYHDLGSAAYISRGKAVVSAFKLNFGGFLGWWVWLFIHIGFLTGYRNRVGAVLGWWFAFTRDLRRERTFTIDDMPLEAGAYGEPPTSTPLRKLGRQAMQTGTGTLPGPLRHFADRLDEVRSADVLDMDQVGRVLVELAADEEFFGPLIAQLPSGSPGSRWLIRPARGPRLVLVHRPDGVMGYTHSHRCWVGIAPVRGVETHQRWDAVRHADGRAELRLADERALVHGDAATLVPPRDVHNHGHVAGSGPSPYSLILLGDDMLLFGREEYDPERGTWRALAPGDPGRDNR